MAKFYSLGQYDPATTPAKLAKLVNSIPKLKHNFPQPPTSYTVLQRQLSEDAQEKILEASEKSELAAPLRFCRGCFSFSRDLSAFSARRERLPTESGEYIQWKANLRELASAAERRCCFCSFMACRLFNDPGLMRVWTTANEPPRPPLGCCALNEEEVPKVKEAIDRLRSLEESYPDAFFTFIIQPTDYCLKKQSYTKLRFLAASSNTGEDGVRKILGYRRDLVIEIYNHPGDPRNCLPLNMPDNFEPGNEETYMWAGYRLQECIYYHEQCSKPLQGKLPARVIQIVNEDDLKLVSNGQHAHYVALSYCWGGPQAFLATTQTLTAMREGFKTSSLPKSLQDAVRVTRKLGVNYLWVDSLCIVQDSDEDKLNELPKMASYYEKAYFTLIASGAKCIDGFLAPKEACEKHKGASSLRNMLSRPFLCREGHTHWCLLREETPYDLSKEPISKRAWTFQERILSPRVLMYGQRVVWQCKSLQVSDGGCDDWKEDVWSRGHRQIQTTLYRASPNGAETNPSAANMSVNDATIPSGSLYDLWYQIIREYSRRSLTFRDDKFPAISALATKIQSINGDEYLAGLYRGDLLRGLLWSTYPTVTLVKPPTWRAPSWSWASVDNPIEYRRLPGPSAVALAEVIKCSVTPKHPTNPHGEIKDAILEVSGPIMTPDRDFTKQIMKKDNRIPHDGLEAVMTDLALFDEDSLNAGFVNWEPPETHILLLLYATMRDGADWDDENGVATTAGLVLGEIEGDKYERVGCFTTVGFQGVKYLTQHIPKKTVKLV